MKLKHLKLVNYRQHRDFEVDFTGHMIAVTGSNGSGKSNFLGAIQFALTGEQPGFTKEDLLNWGAAKSHEGGYVDLEFSHNGMECRIQRRIEKPAVTLSIGPEKYSGTKKVQDMMESVLLIDKDVLRQSVFVRQTEVESCLFDDPRERELAFQRLVGLGDAAKHQKFLTDFLAALAEPKNLADDIAAAKEALASKEAGLAGLEERSRQMGEKLSAAGDEEAIRKEVKVVQGRSVLVGEAITRLGAAAAARASLASAREEAAGLEETDVAGMDARIEALVGRKTFAEAAIARNKARANLRMYLGSARSDLAKVPADIEAQAAEYDANQARKSELSGRIAQLDRLLKDAPDGNVCPLCGSSTDHNIRAEIQAERDAAAKEHMDVSAWLANHGRIPQLLQSRGALADRVATLEAQLADAGDDETTEEVASIEGSISALRKERAEAVAANGRAQAAKARVEAAIEACSAAESEAAAAMAKLPGSRTQAELADVLEAMKARSESLMAALSALTEIKVEKASLDGGIAQARKSVGEAREAIARLEAQNESNMAQAGKIRVLRDVKDWFSYKNGPRVMSQAVMALLVDATNGYLGQFGSPFTVVPSEEGMGFRVVFSDGREMPDPPPEASMLSGGQKIALAVAFRFAVYSTFAGKLGLLSLDEPTAYLDDETIGRFADLLARIRDMAASMDVQVLVATHEKSLSPVFDQVVEIGG